MTTKKSTELTLKDKLSRLTLRQAVKLLGPEGEQLIRLGGTFEIVDFPGQVLLSHDRFELRLPEATVAISLKDDARRRLHWTCDACSTACAHAGAAFSTILEEKTALGLAAPPPERAPVENLGGRELVRQAMDERRERARNEKMILRSMSPKELWTDYIITSAVSGKSYRVAVRGWEPGESYCSCPDFAKNTLGACKHVFNALDKLKRRFPASTRARSYGRTGERRSRSICVTGTRRSCACCFRTGSTGRPSGSSAPSGIARLRTSTTCSAAFAGWRNRGAT